MKLKRLSSLLVMLQIGLGGLLSSNAYAATTGPALDLRASLLTCPTCTITIQTGPTFIHIPGDDPLLDPFGTFFIFVDQIRYKPHFSSALSVIGLAYLSSQSGNFRTGDLTVTTIYGIDAEPNTPSLRSIGFDPADPEGVFFDEEIVGKSGQAFAASSSQKISFGGLNSALGNEFDLSPFSGNRSSMFYVFQTTVPAAELLATVPEPSSYSLMAGGLALLAIGASRKRRLRRSEVEQSNQGAQTGCLANQVI